MDLKKFVKTLSDEEQKSLLQILSGANDEALKEKEAKQKEWKENGRKELLAEIDEFGSQLKELSKEEVTIDLRLTLAVEPSCSVNEFKSSLKQGYSGGVDYIVTGKAAPVDGGRMPKNLAFINEHLNNFLDGACDEVLRLFPAYRKKVEELQKDANALAQKVSTKSREGFVV